MIVTNVPLWSVTIWDKKYNAVEKEWQPLTKRYKYLLSDELDRICVEGGNIRLLYTGKDIGYTTEELAGDALSEGEIVAIPWGGTPSVKYYHGKFVTGDNRIATSSKPDELLNKYLYYYLLGHLPEIASYYRGAGLKHPSMRDILKMNISYPTIIEQKRIIAQLDMIEDLISKRKEQIVSFDELVKSRFIELFGSLHDNEKGLDIVSIEELCTLIKDGTHQTPTYTEDTQNGCKFLSSKDVMTQKICWDDIKYIPAELHEKLYATIQPQRNDILMSKNGVNYGVAAVNDTDEVFDIYVSLALLRPKTNKVNPVYLRCAINNPDTKHQFDSSIKGIGVPNLHLGEIKKTKILLPPMSKQNEFVAFVEQTDKSKLAIQQSLDKLKLLKKSLMQEYFG